RLRMPRGVLMDTQKSAEVIVAACRSGEGLNIRNMGGGQGQHNGGLKGGPVTSINRPFRWRLRGCGNARAG
ncbi:MAG: hypothetical protein JXR76_27535, partial [Deltaproteobacteria bacterium]|nr:hypothetical protein [Deltaproteobacteria bacterium]